MPYIAYSLRLASVSASRRKTDHIVEHTEKAIPAYGFHSVHLHMQVHHNWCIISIFIIEHIVGIVAPTVNFFFFFSPYAVGAEEGKGENKTE